MTPYTEFLTEFYNRWECTDNHGQQSQTIGFKHKLPYEIRLPVISFRLIDMQFPPLSLNIIELMYIWQKEQAMLYLNGNLCQIMHISLA